MALSCFLPKKLTWSSTERNKIFVLMILKSLEKYFISSFHWCGHLCLSCVCVFGGDTWTPHHFFFSWCVWLLFPTYLPSEVCWGSDLISPWSGSNVQLLPTAWSPLLLQWVCRVLLGPAFFLCLPLYPWSTASLTAGPPHPHCLLRVLRVGLFLILSASACSNLAWASHFCSNVTTAKRPSCLGRNRISAPLSLAAPSPPALLAAGMFSVLLGFEDIFLLPFWFSCTSQQLCLPHRRPYLPRKGISSPYPA